MLRIFAVIMVSSLALVAVYSAFGSQVANTSLAKDEATACPTIDKTAVPQGNQLDGQTERLFYATPETKGVYMQDAARICIEPGVRIPAGEPVDYNRTYLIYVEQGSLSVEITAIGDSATPGPGTPGIARYYHSVAAQGYVGEDIIAGSTTEVTAGQGLLLENVTVAFWNTSTTEPVTIFVSGFEEGTGGPPGCTVNCWIPS
jgi:hypothetical protein